MKIVSLSLNLVASLIEYAEVNDAVQVFHFRQEISFLRKLGQINKNYQFKLKVSTETNLNEQNSMAMFTLSVLDRK